MVNMGWSRFPENKPYEQLTWFKAMASNLDNSLMIEWLNILR
jgi:hypothetical protein